MSQVYVLMEQGWEYNDEVYFHSSGGNPKLVFTSKKEAEAEATRRNLKEFQDLVRNGDIREYGYGLDEVLSNDVTEEDLLYVEGIFMTLFNETAEEWWNNSCDTKMQVEPTEEQWQKLMSCFWMKFWSVVPVERG